MCVCVLCRATSLHWNDQKESPANSEVCSPCITVGIAVVCGDCYLCGQHSELAIKAVPSLSAYNEVEIISISVFVFATGYIMSHFSHNCINRRCIKYSGIKYKYQVHHVWYQPVPYQFVPKSVHTHDLRLCLGSGLSK